MQLIERFARWVGTAALVALVLAGGCRGRKTLTGKTVTGDEDVVQPLTELIDKAVELIRTGKEKQVLGFTKQDLPKAEQASVVAALKKVAAADSWEVERVQRFGEAYFRATLSLTGKEAKEVTINFLRQDDRIVFTGGG